MHSTTIDKFPHVKQLLTYSSNSSSPIQAFSYFGNAGAHNNTCFRPQLSPRPKIFCILPLPFVDILISLPQKLLILFLDLSCVYETI